MDKMIIQYKFKEVMRGGKGSATRNQILRKNMVYHNRKIK